MKNLNCSIIKMYLQPINDAKSDLLVKFCIFISHIGNLFAIVLLEIYRTPLCNMIILYLYWYTLHLILYNSMLVTQICSNMCIW